MRTRMLTFLAVLALGAVILMPGMAMAYTINDAVGDSIGYPEYESYGINVLNFTPGHNSGNISFQFFTNFPHDGITVDSGGFSWKTIPADLFITAKYGDGSTYNFAIPLVGHDSFAAGNLYEVSSVKTSDDLDPSHGSAYSYNHGVAVQIATGSDFGIAPGSVVWNTLPSPGMPDFQVNLGSNFYENDSSAIWCLSWGTATCANDVVQGCVPIPGALLLLGGGLVRLAGYARRKRSLA